MKISSIKKIATFQSQKKNNEKSKENHKNDFSFSNTASNALKAYNLAFCAKMSEEELRKKCDELKTQLLKDGIIQNEDEISWYTNKYANEGNIDLAFEIFYKEKLKNVIYDILSTTNAENIEVARYICNNHFPLYKAFEILFTTNKMNAEASLAMCQSEDIPKDVIGALLPNIRSWNNKAVTLIAQDEKLKGKVAIIGGLNPTNSVLVEKLLSDKDYPRKNISYAVSVSNDEKDAIAKANIYDLLVQKSKFSKDQIETFVLLVNKNLFNILIDALAYFEKQEEFSVENIYNICRQILNDYTLNKAKSTHELLKNEELTPDEITQIIVEQKDIKFVEMSLEYLKQNKDFPKEFKAMLISNWDNISANLSDIEGVLSIGAKNLLPVYQMMINNPEIYINGEAETKEEAQREIKDFINENFISILQMASIFSKDTLEFMFRKRLDDVESYIKSFLNFDIKEVDCLKSDNKYLKLLSQLVNCKNIDGSEFSPKEKLTFLDVISAYQVCKVDINKIKITDNKIDIKKLEENLLHHIFKLCGMTDKQINAIPKEKLLKWDVAKAHLLASEQSNMEDDEDETLAQIIKAVNLGMDFKTYIQDDCDFGSVNFATKEMFEKYGLNYDVWFNPPKETEVRFQYIDSNQERMTQIISQIEEDIESLRRTPAKTFIDKHFPDCIFGEKFKINEKYSINKQTLLAFVKNMFKLLDRNIFTRAQANLENPNKKENAQNTLTIKSHLEQRLKDISQCETKKKEKPIDLTIKMWDRNPTHDLFQGNYSTCCVGLGEVNGSAMPHYLVNTMFNMIEFIDNNTNETIGNALCYFVENELGEPTFVIDNIEIANGSKMSNKASEEFLDKILGYCIGLLKSVTNKPIPIFMGTQYNDVYDDELDIVELEKVKLIGEMDCNQIYTDFFKGWNNGDYDFNFSESNKKLQAFYLLDTWEDVEMLDDEILD